MGFYLNKAGLLVLDKVKTRVNMVREGNLESQKCMKALVVLLLIGLGFCLTYVLSEYSQRVAEKEFYDDSDSCMRKFVDTMRVLKGNLNLTQEDLENERNSLLECVSVSIKSYYEHIKTNVTVSSSSSSPS